MPDENTAIHDYLSPRRVDIYLTQRCNLSCPFCFYNNRMRGFGGSLGDDAPLASWLRFLDELEAMQVLEIGLMGGEALLFDGFWSIIDRLANGRMRFALFSNGVLLDDNAVSQLTASHRCSYVQISIDGNEKRHDEVRGEGVYRHAIEAIRRLQDAKIPVRVNMVLTRRSAYDIAQEARHLIEDIGVERLRINPVGGDPSVRLNESELAEAIQILLPLRKDHPEAVRGSGVFKYLKTLRKPFAATDGNPCPNCEAMLGLRCSILSDGSAIPCMDAENAVIGNVFTSRFADMWHGGKWMELRRMVHKPRELPHEECAHCEYAGNCRQNCLSAAALCSERICYRRLEEKLSSRRCAASTEQGHGPLSDTRAVAKH